MAALRSAAGRLVDRRPWHLAMTALGAGLGLAGATDGAPLAPPALAAAAISLLLLALARRPRHGLLAATLLLAGAAAGHARLVAIDAPARAVVDGEPLSAPAHLLTRPRPTPFGSSAEVRVVSGPIRGARLLARAPRWTRWPRRVGVGAEVAIRGRLRRARGGASGFDFGAYLRRRGVAGELALERLRATGRRRGGPAGVVDRMRERAEAALSHGLPADEAALARGMVLGQDEAIAEPVRDDFRTSGLAHLLAVSGQNVMLLCALALPALAAAGTAPGTRAAVLVALIAVYVPLAGAGPSLQRAGVMGVAGVAALAASRPASRSYALVLAAAATLALNPRACGDPGWQLSFAAVLGILWLAPPLRTALGRGPGAGAALAPPRAAPPRSALLPPGAALAPPGAARPLLAAATALRAAARRVLVEGAAVTVAATLATGPLLAHHFGSAPLVALPANLLALPAVAPAMWLGMLAAGLAPLAAVAPPFEQAVVAVAEAAATLSRPAIAWIAWLAESLARVPGAQLRLPLGSQPALLAAYVLLVAGGLGLARVVRFRDGLEAPRARRRPLRRALLAAASALALLLAAKALAPPPVPGRLTVSFLDVGQGDATLVQDPHGAAVLFDGGPPEARVERLLRRAGVRRLSAVVATHASRDHHGGLARVLARYPVGVLLDGGDGSRDPGFRHVLETAVRRGVRRLPALAPLRLRAGSLHIRLLSPPPRAPGPPPEDPNPRAVVAVVSAGGFDLFLSADAESGALAGLQLPDVEAMKVPHHGSADPGLPGILARLRPELAAIEVGANLYGHPAPSTLAALRAAGARTYRTDRHGTVRLVVDRGHMRIEAER